MSELTPPVPPLLVREGGACLAIAGVSYGLRKVRWYNTPMPSTDILSGLNSDQLQAVTHKKGPLLIIAGAGTGKTTVISRRIAWLIEQKLANPGEILALTFTDKAAEEMESRVDLLVPYGYIDVNIATFHAFGDRVLRDHAIDLGLSPDYRVLSQAEQVIFFREHIFEFPLKHYKSLSDPTKHVEALLGVISRAKDEDIGPEEYLRWAKKKGTRYQVPGISGRREQLEVAKVYKKYQELKLKHGLVDFGDQVNLVLKLFRDNPAIRKEYQGRYKFILVDEFQDTNYAQFELLKLLAGKRANITVVGDDDQSIYKFRGAAISNILNFEKIYKKCSKVVLTDNYRSTQAILDAARRLIRHNDPERLEVKSGIDKRLVSMLEPASEPRGSNKLRNRDVQSQVPKQILPLHKHFDRVQSEADWVAKTIKEKFDKGEYKLSDFAILVRSNADAEPFRQSLNMLGLPHQFSGGGGLYVFPEIKMAVSFLRVIGDLADSVSLYELALSEVYRLGPLDLQKISTFAKRRNYTLHHAFTHLGESRVAGSEFQVLSDINEGTLAAVAKIMEDIRHYLDFARGKSTGELLYHFLKQSGYLAKLAREEKDDRIRNLARFFEKVREFKAVAEVDRVAEFVQYLNILKESGDDPASAQPDSDVDAVNVLTAHKAKGLEFPVVFMVCLVGDKFPVRSRRQPIELPDELIKEEVPPGDVHLLEERRLCYVGMTRARRELYFTSAVDYGGKRGRKVSRFVLEALDLPLADITMLKSPVLDQIELFSGAGPLPASAKPRSPDAVVLLSHYQIEDYLTCPLKYKYVHVLRVPLLPNHQIIFGSAVHQAVQAYFSAKLNKKKLPLKELLAVFKRNWSSEGFISREHETQRYASGVAALTRFFKTEPKRGRRPIAVEDEFAVVEDKIQLKGRYDLVEQGPGARDQVPGGIYIVDFKTTEVREQAQADKKVKSSRQLAIYALAWQKKHGRLPEKLELNFIESGLVGSLTPNAKSLAKVWAEIKQVADGIRAADWHATPGYRACGYCPYREICPSAAN